MSLKGLRLKIEGSSVARLLRRFRPVTDLDLTKEEPGQPTERADVITDDETFEKRLESVNVEIRIPFVFEIRTGIQTTPRSPVSNAAAAFLLTGAGCLCLSVLHMVGAPQWAQLAGLLLPWAVATLNQLVFRRRGTGGRIA